MQKVTLKKAKPYIIEGGMLVLFGVLVWVGAFYLQAQIQAKKDRLQELDVTAENRYRQMAALPDLSKQNDFIAANEGTLQKVVLTKDRLVELIRTIEGLANESGVSLKITSQDNTLLESKTTAQPDQKKPALAGDDASQPGKAPAKKPTGIMADIPFQNFIRVTVTATGTYPQVVTFLHSLETLPYALDVVGIKMAEHTESTAFGTPDTGVNPFNPDGTLVPQTVIVKPQVLRLDATYDTLIYLKK